MANEQKGNQRNEEAAIRQQQTGTDTRGPQPDQQPSERQRTGGDASQKARPTWGEQTPDKDQERATGGGGSSDSDGQQQ